MAEFMNVSNISQSHQANDNNAKSTTSSGDIDAKFKEIITRNNNCQQASEVRNALYDFNELLKEITLAPSQAEIDALSKLCESKLKQNISEQKKYNDTLTAVVNQYDVILAKDLIRNSERDAMLQFMPELYAQIDVECAEIHGIAKSTLVEQDMIEEDYVTNMNYKLQQTNAIGEEYTALFQEARNKELRDNLDQAKVDSILRDAYTQVDKSVAALLTGDLSLWDLLIVSF